MHRPAKGYQEIGLQIASPTIFLLPLRTSFFCKRFSLLAKFCASNHLTRSPSYSKSSSTLIFCSSLLNTFGLFVVRASIYRKLFLDHSLCVCLPFDDCFLLDGDNGQAFSLKSKMRLIDVFLFAIDLDNIK